MSFIQEASKQECEGLQRTIAELEASKLAEEAGRRSGEVEGKGEVIAAEVSPPSVVLLAIESVGGAVGGEGARIGGTRGRLGCGRGRMPVYGVGSISSP